MNQDPDSTLDARFLWAVDAWCARNGASAGAFGTAARRDCGFVASRHERRAPLAVGDGTVLPGSGFVAAHAQESVLDVWAPLRRAF